MVGHQSLNLLQQVAIDSYPAATLILTFGLLTEFFGFLIWYRKTRTPLMLLLIAMHVGILISMRINFPANNALLLALAVPWSSLLDRAILKLRRDKRTGLHRLLARLA
jgi:hypothetical protein